MSRRESLSQFSSLSIFSGHEGSKERFQVIKEGYVNVAKQAQQLDVSKMTFSSRYSTLTRDGRIKMELGDSCEIHIIEECLVINPMLFRLRVRDERNLQSDELYDILCQLSDEVESTDWLINIEVALRTRLERFKNELDCARGQLAVKEISALNVTIENVDIMNNSPVYQCFYYNQNFRIRGIDGRQTSSFQIEDVLVDEVNLPMCFKLKTPGRYFLCLCNDVDEYNRWLSAIRRSQRKKRRRKRVSNSVVGAGSPSTVRGDLLIGPTPDKLVRATVKYQVQSRVLETKDFAGVSDSFYIERCIQMPPTFEGGYQFVYMAILPHQYDDEVEKNNIKLYVKCDKQDYEKWLNAFEMDLDQVLRLLEKVIMQIELRRIMKNESGSEKIKRLVNFASATHLMSLSNSDLEEVLVSVEEWPVARLERLIQTLLKMFTEPLVPFSVQKGFIELGKQILAKNCEYELFHKQTLECINKIPDERREILEKLILHIFRLSAYYNQRKMDQRHETRKRSVASSRDLMVWNRLSKYLFRFNEQGLAEVDCDNNLKAVTQVVMCFQSRFVEQMKHQASHSKSRRRDFEETCKQQ